MAIPLTLQPIQTSTTTPTTSPPPITPLSPNSRPSTADSSQAALKSPSSASTASSATAAQEKRKTSRRANTAERRATHNAVERQRRETLNGRFLDLASLLPNLTSVRRPSKSAIVNSSIALIHQSRRQKALAALELRALYTQFLALKAEADEWRARAGVGCVEEGERSREFWEMIREGEEVLKGAAGGEKEAMRTVREIGEEEGRARVLAEAAASTSHGSGSAGAGGRRDSADGDDDYLGDDGMEDDLPVVVPQQQPQVVHHAQVQQHHQVHVPTHHQVVVSEATAVPVPMTVTSNNNHLAHQQHLAQVHAQAQAQIQAAQIIQQQQQQQQRARAATVSVPQDNRIFAHQVPTSYPTQYQQQMHHHVQMQQHHQHQQPQQPFDSGADLFNFAADHLGLYNAYSAPNTLNPGFDIKPEPTPSWPGLVTAPVSPPFLGGGDDSSSSSSSAGGSPSPVVGRRSRAGSMTVAQAQVVGAAGFY
jgi:hypothetical protein